VTRVGGVLFDFGGTLAEYPREEIFGSILAEMGVLVNEEDLRRAIKKGDEYWDENYGQSGEWNDEVMVELDCLILREAGLRDGVDGVASFIVRRWKDLGEKYGWVLCPDVEACLEELRSEGLRLGVVSNCTSEGFLEDKLGCLGIREFFTCLVSSGSEGVSKPDPEIFRIASRRIGLSVGSLVHVGDSPKMDIQGGAAAGLRAVLVDREDAFPDFGGLKIRDFEELTGFIEHMDS
jgi:putative hydrolase of the HAD superfamily